MHQQELLETTAKGALAGLAGTAVMTIAMKNAPSLMEKLGFSQPMAARQQPSGGIQQEEPTQKLARQVGEKVLHTPLKQEQKEIAGQTIHWGYGAAWGALYGLTQSQLPGSLHLQGLLLGGLVGAVATAAVPALDLAPAPTEQPPEQTAMNLALHLLYGWVTAATFAALTNSSQAPISHAREGQWSGRVESSSAGEWPASTAQGREPWKQADFTPLGDQADRQHNTRQRHRPNGGSAQRPGSESQSSDQNARAGIYYPSEAIDNISLPEMASWSPGPSDPSRYTNPGGQMAQFSTQRCQDVMTKDPVYCTPQEPIERVAKIMRDEDIGVVPVVDNPESRMLIGIVTDRDLVVRVLATGSAADTMTVEQVMTRNPVSCRPEDNVQRALEIMAEHQLRRVPLVDDENRIVGIIAQADIARHIQVPEQVAEVVEEISQPA
jgi:CBS domain-containing protein